MNNRAELILALRDEISSGMAKVNASLAQTRQAVEGLGGAGEKAAKQHAAGWTSATEKAGSYATQLLSVVGVTLSVAGAAYAAQRAYGAWFSLISGGIAAVDEFQKKIVGTSYIMATMSDVPAPDLSKSYSQWKDFHKWLYAESIRVDKQSAASSGEIFAVALEMEKKGVVAKTREEMEVVGRLTDLMKGVIPTHASLQEQVRGEIEAMMEGVNRLGAQTSKILTQIDPEFKKNIASARETGRAWEYLGRILPQIDQYTKDIMGTWDAVGASLRSAWDIVQIKAFGDAHKDVVGMATELGNRLVDNGKLTRDGEAAAAALSRAWSGVRDKIYEAYDYVLSNSDQIIKDVGSIASGVGAIAGGAFSAAKGMAEFVRQLKAASENPLVGMLWGAAAGSRLGPWGAVVGGATGFAAAGQRGNEGEVARGLARAQNEFEGYETAGEGLRQSYADGTSGSPYTPKVRLPGGTGGGGGGGAGKGLEAAERSLENFVQRMRFETAKASGEGMAALNEWYAKESIDLDRLEAKVGVSLEARQAKEAAYNSKRTKIETDFYTLVAKESGNAYAGIEAQATNWLTKYQGIAGAETEFAAIKARKIWELDVKNHTERLELEKSFYDQAAGLAVDLTDQVGLRREALSREIEIQRYQLAVQLEQLTVAKKITSEERDRYLANQALLAQQKRLNFELENNKGLTGWAYNRVKSESQKNTWADAMEGLEGFVSDAWTQGVQGALSKTKIDVVELGKTFALSAILNLGKQGIHKLFTEGAKLVLGSSAVGQPGTSPARPLYVLDVSKGTMGQGGISGILGGLFGGGGSGGEEANKITGMWNGIINGFDSVFTSGSNELMNTSTYWGGMFGNSNANLLMNSGTYGGMFTSAVGALESTSGTWGGMFGEAISGLISAVSGGGGGGIFGTIGGIVGGIADTVLGFFHTGGQIMHGGGPVLPAVYAHSGINLKDDERLIIGQTGEGMLSRRGMAGLSRGWFDDLNQGNYDVVGPSLIRRRGGPAAPASVNAPAPPAPAPRPHLNLFIKLPSGEIYREDDIWRMTNKGISKGKIRIGKR
jgi:hypothetical protein